MTMRVGRGKETSRLANKLEKIGTTNFKQAADDDHRDADDGNRIDQGRLHCRLQLHCLLDVCREALQDQIENTAGFTSIDHVHGQIIEHFGILLHCRGQSRATFYGGSNARQCLLERRILLVRCQNFQALYQRQTGIDHHRKLAEEDRDILHRNLGRSQCRKRELLPLFLDGYSGNSFARKRRFQYLLVFCNTLAVDLCSGCVLSRECKNRHIATSSVF